MRSMAALVGLVVLCFVGPAAAETKSTWEEDHRAYGLALGRGDDAEALRRAVRLAERGISSYWAMIVADLYWRGRGRPADPAEAAKWYRRAAVRHNRDAMLAVARAHYSGKGAEQDLQAAYFWLGQAASKDVPRALLEYAIYARRGFPLARDESYAARRIERGIDLIYSQARIDQDIRSNAIPARRATYARAFRIFACPWAAPPDFEQARRYLALAVKEGWAEGEALLPKLERAEKAASPLCTEE